MTMFLASLAGIPPLGGWIAKFNAFKAVLDAGTDVGLRAGRHRRRQHRHRRRLLPAGDARDVDERPRPTATRRRSSRRRRSSAALAITAAGTLVLGVLPGLVMRFADLERPHRRARRLMAAAGRAADDIRARHRRRRRGDPVRRVHGPRPVRAARLLHRSERRAGRAPRRLPHLARGRPAVRRRRRPLPRRRVGAPRPARPVHGRRRRRRPGHAGPRRAGRRAGVLRRRCATSPSRSSAAQRARHPAGVESRADLPDGPDRRRRAGQRAARQPAVPPRRVRRRHGARRSSTDGRRRHVRRGAVGAVRPGAGRAAGDGRATAPGRRCRTPPRGWVPTPRARSCGAAAWSSIDYARPTTAELAAPAVAVVAAHVPRPRARRRTTSPTPGDQDITADVALDQLPEPDAVRSQAQFLQRWGIDELVDEGRRAWAAAAARARPRRRWRCAAACREAEALLDPAGLGGFTVARVEICPDRR